MKDCGNLTVEWFPGSICTAELLTKVLSVEMNNFHRSQIGISEIVGQRDWQLVDNKELKRKGTKSDEQTLGVKDEIPSAEDLATFSAKRGLSVEGLVSFENLLQRVGIKVQAGTVTQLIQLMVYLRGLFQPGHVLVLLSLLRKALICTVFQRF